MQITALEMEGFRHHEGKVRYVFGGHDVEIRGENGAGKTTVAEAITWGLFGTNLGGSNRVDNLIHTRAKAMRVAVRFIGQDGEEHEVVRVRRARGGEILLDGRRASQVDIERVAGPSRYWLPVFWPATIGTWTDSQAREFFSWLLRRVEPLEVLEALGPAYAETLASLRLENPEAAAQETRRQLAEAEKRLEQLRGRLEALREQAKQEPPEVIEPDHSEELARLEAEYRQLEAPDTSALEAEIQRLSEAVGRARAEMAALQQQMEDPESLPDQCPTCGQTISIQYRAQLREAIAQRNEERRQKVHEAIERGRQANRRLKELQRQLEALRRGGDEARRQELAAQIDELRQLQQAHRLQVELRQRLLAKQEEARKAVRQTERAIEDTEALIGQYRRELDALRAYVAKHAELQVQQLTDHLTHVSIQLHEIVKTTGELKPVFRLLYQDRPYAVLSTSERIRAGLEIATLVNRITGVDFPVFVDNAESITSFDRPVASQVFVARVAAGEALSVRPVGEEAVSRV
ncbi:MAG TPA: AAA family ATPase [Thermaerobacter sp.]